MVGKSFLDILDHDVLRRGFLDDVNKLGIKSRQFQEHNGMGAVSPRNGEWLNPEYPDKGNFLLSKWSCQPWSELISKTNIHLLSIEDKEVLVKHRLFTGVR